MKQKDGNENHSPDRTPREDRKTGSDDEIWDQAMEILDADDGKSLAEKKKAMAECLLGDENPQITDMLVDFAMGEKQASDLKSRFWESGAVLGTGGGILLRDVQEEDQKGFFEIQRTYSEFSKILEHPSVRTMLWREHCGSKCLSCSIVVEGTYAGYCGINNLTHSPWEIGIELLPEWTRRGIGYVAVSTMVREIRKRLGVREFCARIAPKNEASQRLFEKLGAVPGGLEDFMPHVQELLPAGEEKPSTTDASLQRAAEKFKVTPEELSGRILRYRLTTE